MVAVQTYAIGGFTLEALLIVKRWSLSYFIDEISRFERPAFRYLESLDLDLLS